MFALSFTLHYVGLLNLWDSVVNMNCLNWTQLWSTY